MDGEEILQGGCHDAGAVVRSGEDVLLPSNQHSGSIHAFLKRIRAGGFRGGVSSRWRSIPTVASVCDLCPGMFRFRRTRRGPRPTRRWHRWRCSFGDFTDASVGLSLDGEWSSELADPDGGPVMCHNDVCLENVVFRDGHAVALLDFDFAAPGRREFDLAAFARMCVPIDDEVNASRLGWASNDKPVRLRVVCDAYGCDESGRAEVLACLSDSIVRGGEFVRRRVEAGESTFIEMWNNMGGQERFDRPTSVVVGQPPGLRRRNAIASSRRDYLCHGWAGLFGCSLGRDRIIGR